MSYSRPGMHRFLALVGLIAAFLSPVVARAYCEMGSWGMRCCCESQTALEAMPGLPALQTAMTCCPQGQCVATPAPSLGKSTDPIGGPSAPAIAVTWFDDPGSFEPKMPLPAIDCATLGVSHEARGPPVPLFLLHRMLLV